MTIIELGALGEFLGSIGVIVTLIYVSIQIRQNTRASQAASREAMSRTTIDLMMDLTADESRLAFWRRALTNPDSLDDDEMLRGAMTRPIFLIFAGIATIAAVERIADSCDAQRNAKDQPI